MVSRHGRYGFAAFAAWNLLSALRYQLSAGWGIVLVAGLVTLFAKLKLKHLRSDWNGFTPRALRIRCVRCVEFAISPPLSAFGWVGDCFNCGISYINYKTQTQTSKIRLQWFHATGATDSLRSLRGICYQPSAISFRLGGGLF